MQLSDHLDPFSEGGPLSDVAEESVSYRENLKWFMLLRCLNYNSRGNRKMCHALTVEVVVTMLTNIKVRTMFLP